MWRRYMAWAETPHGRRVIALKVFITIWTLAVFLHPAIGVAGSVVWIWSKLDA